MFDNVESHYAAAVAERGVAARRAERMGGLVPPGDGPRRLRGLHPALAWATKTYAIASRAARAVTPARGLASR